MTRVNLLRADVGWHLYTLRTTISNLVFYFDVPGDEMATQGWRDSIRQDVQDRFQNAIGTDDLLRIIDRNTLTNRRSDALTLISILHTNAGMKRDDWGQDVPVSVKNLRQFCIDLEKLEREADIQGDSPPVATNNSIETVLKEPAHKPNPIPADKRTKPMTKKAAARHLGRTGDESRAVEWLNKCIEDGLIRYHQTSRQSGIYHLDDFPEDKHRHIKP